MSVPQDALEQSIEAEILRQQKLNEGGGTPPPADEPPADEPPPEEEPVEEELEEEEEPGEEEEQEEPAAAAPAGTKPAKRARENETVRALRERAQRAEAALAADQARRAQEEAARQQREQQERIRREDAEVAALPDEERPAAQQRLFNQRVATETLRQQRVLSDMQDSNAFRAACDSDPTLKAVSGMVENVAQQFIRAGHAVNRETIAENLIGKMVRNGQLQKLLKTQSQPKPKKKVPAGRASGGGRSGERRNSGEPSREELMKRLRDKPI